jgi:hypothetical protein
MRVDKTVTLGVCRITGKIYNIKHLEGGFMNDKGQIERQSSYLRGIQGKVDYSKMIYFYYRGDYKEYEKFTPVISQEEYDNIKQSIKKTFGKRSIIDRMNEWLNDKSNTNLTHDIQKQLENSVINLS